MHTKRQLNRKRVALLVAASVLIGGGVAYATIPSGDGVYFACMLKSGGTIRLIDRRFSRDTR
ncbi:MAG TPA: hypothetical protein VFA66_06590 [Gaiellaceae bacterium]|nr:hypothetical protein [Gaiellaceae bacterium]